MATRHDDFCVDNVVEEQQTIDDLISSIISFTPTFIPNPEGVQRRKSVESAGTSSTSLRTSSPLSTQTRKARGRPPKAAVYPPSPLPSIPANNISYDTVIECLKKLNEQSKNLLKCVQVLYDKIERNSVGTVTNTPNEEAPKTVLEGVSKSLEKIENNLNSNILFCRGPTVESLIADNTNETTPPNLERLKGKVCRAAFGDEVTGVDISNVNISLLGRERKFIKLDCRIPSSKLHLLKQARKNKPQCIYVSEFLMKTKLTIFYNLRQLKKQYPTKIKSVFAKGGNIFYKLQNSSEAVQVNSLSDLQKILVTANSSVTEGGD